MNSKKQIFIEAYWGNVSDAAEAAGISTATAYRWLRDPEVILAISKRAKLYANVLVADRLERQTFWTSIMRDPANNINDRIKVSELLGKSQCDFSEKHIHEGGDNPVQHVLHRELEERITLLSEIRDPDIYNF